MSGIIEHASLAQICKKGQILTSNCKKYKIEKNSYSGELFYSSYGIGCEYSGRDVFVHVSPIYPQNGRVSNTQKEDSTIDAILKSLIQKDKLKDTAFTCVSFTDVYNSSIVNKFVKGLFNEFSDQDISDLLESNNIQELNTKIIQLTHKYSIEDIDTRTLVSCSVVVTLLPGIPVSFTIKNTFALSTTLISTNIYKLKKYVM